MNYQIRLGNRIPVGLNFIIHFKHLKYTQIIHYLPIDAFLEVGISNIELVIVQRLYLSVRFITNQ